MKKKYTKRKAKPRFTKAELAYLNMLINTANNTDNNDMYICPDAVTISENEGFTKSRVYELEKILENKGVIKRTNLRVFKYLNPNKNQLNYT